MSPFLSIGAAVANRSAKSFHYAPGLGERTEAFICLTLMILDEERLVLWTWVFVAVIVFTMGQRLRQAYDMLSERDKQDQARHSPVGVAAARPVSRSQPLPRSRSRN
jgi:hypothetical protein